MLLPFYDIFDEQRYFEPATEQTLTVLNGQPLAITICEDAWNDKGFWSRRLYPVDPVDELMRQWRALPDPLAVHPRVVLNISASPFWCGKPQLRRKMLSVLARRHNAIVAMVNQVGGNDSLVFDGSSVVLAPNGEVVAQAASFREDLIVFDTEALQAIRKPAELESSGESASGANHSRRTARPGKLLCWGRATTCASAASGRRWWDSRAASTRRWWRPSRWRRWARRMCWAWECPASSLRAGSVDDARALTVNLGIRYELIAIHDVFTAYQSTLEPLFAGTPFGLAEENVQSRIRGGLLMALSNKFGALVLTTGNKSEMSTGYCTLYGDMVGALAVIGDVLKTRVYALSRYANREREVIPRATMEKPPSAELRPGQRDTDSLPPYEVLDPILEAYVERYASAEQIVEERKAAGRPVDLGPGPARSSAGGAQRVQAPAGGARPQSDAKVLRQRPPLSHRREGRTVTSKGEAPSKGEAGWRRALRSDGPFPVE